MKFSSPQQKKVFDFIKEFREENDYDPSYQEIADGLDLSAVSTIWEHIQNLQEKGFLEKSYNEKRNFKVDKEKGIEDKL